MTKFITAKTDKGLEIKCDGESFAVGMDVYTEADGKKTPVPDGEHKLENGTTLKVAAGKITEIAEMTDDEQAEQVIQSAVKPLLAELEAKFNAAIKKKDDEIAELKTKLANLPAAQSATGKTDEKGGKQMTKKQALEFRLNTLRKKSTEVTTKK